MWLAALSGWIAERKQKQHRPYSCEHWCHFTGTLSDQANFTDSVLGSYCCISSCNYVDFPHYPVKNKTKHNKTNYNNLPPPKKKTTQTNTAPLPHTQKTPNHFVSVFLILLTCHTRLWPREEATKTDPRCTSLCLPKRNCGLVLPNPLITLCKPFPVQSLDTVQAPSRRKENGLSLKCLREEINK